MERKPDFDIDRLIFRYYNMKPSNQGCVVGYLGNFGLFIIK